MHDRQSGQALIEYIFIFALFTGVSLTVAKGVGNYSSKIFKGFAYALTQELSVGYCSDRGCWHNAYENGVD